MAVDEKVKTILSELSGQRVIENDFSLQNDLALDSLSMVTLLIEIENVFEIQLDEADMNPFDLETVDDIIALVKRYGVLDHAEEN